MVIRVLSSYRGVLTAHVLYEAGDYVVDDTIPADIAEKLVNAKRAVEVRPAKKSKAKPASDEN